MQNFQRKLSFIAVPLVAALLCAAPAWAGEAAEADAAVVPGAKNFGLGLVVGTRERPYKGLDSDTRVLPFISYENSWVRIQGLGAVFKLGNAGGVSFGLRADYSLNGYKATDAPVLAGMEDRKGSFWIGPNVRWHTDFANLSGEISTDASGHSKGSQARFSLDRTFVADRFSITPRASALWLDRKYVDYYFGVRTDEVTSGRSAYAGQSTVNLELGLRTAYMLAPNQSIFLDVSTTRLGNGIKDSPLVDKSTESGFRLGYLYRF